MTFAETTENECINVRHCRRTPATYISGKTDNPCSAVSLRELSYLSESVDATAMDIVANGLNLICNIFAK